MALTSGIQTTVVGLVPTPRCRGVNMADAKRNKRGNPTEGASYRQSVAVDTTGMDPEMKSTLFGPTGMHGTPTLKKPKPLKKLMDWLGMKE